MLRSWRAPRVATVRVGIRVRFFFVRTNYSRLCKGFLEEMSGKKAVLRVSSRNAHLKLEPSQEACGHGRRGGRARGTGPHQPGPPRAPSAQGGRAHPREPGRRRRNRPVAAEPDRKRQARAQTGPAAKPGRGAGRGHRPAAGSGAAQPPGRAGNRAGTGPARPALRVARTCPKSASARGCRWTCWSPWWDCSTSSNAGWTSRSPRPKRHAAPTPNCGRKCGRGTTTSRSMEAEAQKLLAAVGHARGPLSHHVTADIAEHLGFSLHYVGDLPHSTRSVTDLKNRRIYLTQGQRSDHDPRSVLLQALGHYVLGHQTPTDYARFPAPARRTRTISPPPCCCPSTPPWTSSRRPRRPRRSPSRTSGTPSPSPTRPPRTASPTSPPSTWASPRHFQKTHRAASSTRPTRTTA